MYIYAHHLHSRSSSASKNPSFDVSNLAKVSCSASREAPGANPASCPRSILAGISEWGGEGGVSRGWTYIHVYIHTYIHVL